MTNKNDREDQPVRSECSEHTSRQYEIPRGGMANQKKKKKKKGSNKGDVCFSI